MTFVSQFRILTPLLVFEAAHTPPYPVLRPIIADRVARFQQSPTNPLAAMANRARIGAPRLRHILAARPECRGALCAVQVLTPVPSGRIGGGLFRGCCVNLFPPLPTHISKLAQGWRNFILLGVQ